VKGCEEVVSWVGPAVGKIPYEVRGTHLGGKLSQPAAKGKTRKTFTVVKLHRHVSPREGRRKEKGKVKSKLDSARGEHEGGSPPKFTKKSTKTGKIIP